MQDYEISDDTLAIISKDDNKTMVYEKNDKFLVDQSSNKIMENSCEYFGSTLIGRQNGTTSIMGITHKVPVIIEESNNLIFFPTSSPRLKNCSWISLNNILEYEKRNNQCIIKFKDNRVIKLNTSYGIINNQILRASRLQMMLNIRKSSKNDKKDKKSR